MPHRIAGQLRCTTVIRRRILLSVAAPALLVGAGATLELLTVTRSGDKESYEYTIILENVDSPSALPVVQVLLFDRTGVQVGGDRVEGAGMLRPGDKQTFSGEIPLFMDATPEYFYVDSGKR